MSDKKQNQKSNPNVPAYKLLDSGEGRKLEQVGPIKINRQASLALWPTGLSDKQWSQADAFHHRSDKGGGFWGYGPTGQAKTSKFAEEWQTQVGPFVLNTKLTSFGHLGFFAEQLDQWNWFIETIPKINNTLGRPAKILNLFGYTGCSSLALAQGGAEVTHIDAAKGIVDWGKENQKLNPQVPQDSIRWIVEDCQAFVEKEIRRGNTYDGVVLDPPSYGRGTKKNQVFKIEESLTPLLAKISEVMNPEIHLIHFSCHTPGFTGKILENLTRHAFNVEGLNFQSEEMVIDCENKSKSLPSGICLKATRQ